MDQTTLLQCITPTTAELLRWWFDPRRDGPRLRDSQRRAIVRILAAHEAPAAARPTVHRVALPLGRDRIQVLLVLLIWQWLNHRDAPCDPRFTNCFLLVAPHPVARGHLYDALRGQPNRWDPGRRDFDTADLVRWAGLLSPEVRREDLQRFVRERDCRNAQALQAAADEGAIVIADGRTEALEHLTRLPHAMVFHDETQAAFEPWRDGDTSHAAWRWHLRRIAAARGAQCTQVVFTDAPDEPPETGHRRRASAELL